MEHGEWLELVSAHADGELSAREAETLAGHLAVCAACRDQLEEFERARRRARMREPAGQTRLVEEILASRDLDRDTAGSRPVLLRRAALATAAAAAAVVVALILMPGTDAPSRDVASRHVAEALADAVRAA